DARQPDLDEAEPARPGAGGRICLRVRLRHAGHCIGHQTSAPKDRGLILGCSPTAGGETRPPRGTLRIMAKTVIQHVLGRLKDIGIDDVFAVAGDFAFPIHDAIVDDPRINYIGCCNELNAGYAADGYARVRGLGAVSTTYGVGELSAISAIA